MTELNFCDPGSRGSSTGSSKNHNCYPQKALCHKGFRGVGSRGNSTSNFSAEKRFVRKHVLDLGTRIVFCGHKHGYNCYLCYLRRAKPCIYWVFRGSSTRKCCYPYCYPLLPSNY